MTDKAADTNKPCYSVVVLDAHGDITVEGVFLDLDRATAMACELVFEQAEMIAPLVGNSEKMWSDLRSLKEEGNLDMLIDLWNTFVGLSSREYGEEFSFISVNASRIHE